MDENTPLTHSDTIGGLDQKSRKDSSVVDKHVIGTRSKKSKINSTVGPANITTIRTKKAVHWNSKIGKRRHLSLKEMKREERESLWYNSNEDKFMLEIAKVTVKMIMRGEPCDDVDFCSRGLEGKVPVESKKRSRNKRKVIQAVLMEQELQRLEGIRNPSQLARASFKHTKDIAVLAFERAKKDEAEEQSTT